VIAAVTWSGRDGKDGALTREPPGSSGGPGERLVAGIRFAVIVGVAIAASGLSGHEVGWPAITAALGPTAYVFAAHPDSEAARWRNAVLGHGVGVAAGLASLAVFGLWDAAGQAAVGHPTWPEVGAATMAICVTLMALELVRSHHAPAGATSLLVATGLATPGTRLDGLLLGLVVVLIVGPVAGRWLPLRPHTHRRA
jgi:hypothetical protein